MGKIVLSLVLALETIAAVSMADQKSGRVHLQVIGDSGTTMFAITVDEAQDDEMAIVDVCYWTKFPGIQAKLVRCKTDVIPAISELSVATTPVPVSKTEIQSVKVKIAKVLVEESFPFKQNQ